MIGHKLGEGREAEVFSWDNNAVIKLYRHGFSGHQAEAAVLAHLEGRGGAPMLLEVVEHDQRSGLVLERLSGTDMLALLQRQPWKLATLAHQLAQTHLHMHDVEAPQSFPDIRDVLAARIRRAAMSTPLRDFALRVLDTLPPGDRLVHGDYHPGNVLLTSDQAGVIDWASAARGAPEADHARTLLLLRRGTPLPGTPLLARGLMATGRWAFADIYARKYRTGAPQPPQALSAWITVNVAARLSEGIDIERSTLIGLLESSLRRDQRQS